MDIIQSYTGLYKGIWPMTRKGIACAGNMIVDMVYPVEAIPGPGELTTILGGSTRSTGGALCNVITDLAIMDSALPLTAVFAPSVKMQPEQIKGKVGAGDAFCAGALYAANQGGTLEAALTLGNAAAAASLTEPGATEGMQSVEKLMKNPNP
jgi:sugar/nucleoside kinase (ribokinase family)